MTQEDKVALKEFLIGAAVAISITAVFLVLIFASGIISFGDTEQKFEVVDTYNGCNVVRYTPDYSARYTYFLDCK